MQRLSGAAKPRPVDLDVLSVAHRAEGDGLARLPATAPFLAPGDVVQWRYGPASTRCGWCGTTSAAWSRGSPPTPRLIAWRPADGRRAAR